MTVKPKCPSCMSEYRDIKKCRKCLKYCCSQCSIEVLCLDCYTKEYTFLELKEYRKDKYAHKL